MIFHQYLNGAIWLAYLVAGLFFLRFWRQSKDRLFAIFAVAFWVLSVERLLLGVVGVEHEFRPYVYLIRLSAFGFILFAAINRSRRK